MKFTDQNIEFKKRSLIIVTFKENLDAFKKSINWNELKEDGSDLLKFNYKNIIPAIGIMRILQKAATGSYVSELMYPIYEMSTAKKLFQFPPHDPVINTVYAATELFPNQYVQMGNFHDYFRELKHSSFIELCANLGAKEIYLEYAEINEKSFDFKIDSTFPTELGNLNLGISDGGSEKKSNFGKLAFTFTKENNSIKKFSSPWLESEPTWKAMVNMRTKNNLSTCSADFNYSNDMGVNFDLSLKLQSIGLNIGGDFKELIKVRLKYKITFW